MSISIHRTHDAEAVLSVLRDPAVFALIRGDCVIEPEAFRPSNIEDDAYYFLIAEVDGVLAGCVIFDPVIPSVYDAHLNVLPAYWGKGIGKEIALRALCWMFEHTDCTRMEAEIPVASYCDPVFRVAQKCGFRVIGTEENTRMMVLKRESFDELFPIGASHGLR